MIREVREDEPLAEDRRVEAIELERREEELERREECRSGAEWLDDGGAQN